MVFVNTSGKEVVMSGRSGWVGTVAGLVIVSWAGQFAVAQVEWMIDAPVVCPGPPGSWNEDRCHVGDVFVDTFKTGDTISGVGVVP